MNLVGITKLFEDRDIATQKITETIMDALRPNVLAAFDILLGVPTTSVQWIHVFLDDAEKADDVDSDDYLQLYGNITYHKATANPFIKKLFFDDSDQDVVVKNVRFDINAEAVEMSHVEIIKMVLDTVDAMELLSSYSINDNPTDFQFGELTDNQRIGLRKNTSTYLH